MIDTLVDFFASHGFEIQTTGWDWVAQHEGLACLRGRDLGDSAPGRLLSAYPELFIYHKHREATSGVAFVVLADDRGEIDKSREGILDRYFPRPILIVHRRENGQLAGRWFDETSLSPLEDLMTAAGF